ncbi:hypothetical protein ACVXG7_16180 [Enterobacter hormaechei]
MNGKKAVFLGLFPTPTGNPLIIVDGIRENLTDIEKPPPGVNVELAFETSRFSVKT